MKNDKNLDSISGSSTVTLGRRAAEISGVLPVTARLHQSGVWGWSCGGSLALSGEGGLWAAGSSGFGDEGGTPLGDGTAGGGGDGSGSSACGWSSGSAAFSSSCSPSPFSISLPAGGCA